MRILLVSNHGADRTYGGAERYVSDLDAALRARGHDVEIVSAFPVSDAFAAHTRTLHSTDWRTDPRRRLRNHVDDWRAAPTARLARLLREIAPDIVHTNNLPGIATGVWEQARRLELPVVHTLHDYQLLCPRTTLMRPDGTRCRPHPLLCGRRTRRLARWAGAVDVVVGVSAHVLGRHGDFFPESTVRRVIRPPLAGPTGATAPAPGALVTIGYLGALRHFKGVERLIDAASRLAAIGIRVRVAGRGPLEGAVRDASAIEYVGALEGAEVGAFLASCDLGVVPSLWEEPGLGYTACEWLASGRPVLLTRRGGLAETAALGGTVTFDGTADGLIETLRVLREGGRWQRLVGSLPHPDRGAEMARWTDRHLDAYRSAGAPGTGSA